MEDNSPTLNRPINLLRDNKLSSAPDNKSRKFTLKRFCVTLYFFLPFMLSIYMALMIFLFSGFAGSGGIITVNLLIAGSIVSSLWHGYLFKSLQQCKAWARNVGIFSVIIYTLITIYIMLPKAQLVIYLFSEPKESFIAKTALTGIYFFSSLFHIITLYSILGFVVLYLLIFDKQIKESFQSPFV